MKKDIPNHKVEDLAIAIVPRETPSDPIEIKEDDLWDCLLYTSPSPRDATLSRMPSSA